ncbi:MAG: YqgE/AlgH family protein [Rickettsiales bacterium]
MDDKLLKTPNPESSLAGQLLIATPQVQGSCFDRSVIYMCAHNKEGAMGVIINYPVATVQLEEILEQLNIESDVAMPDVPIHFGGPVESYRGFVIHSSDHAPQEAIFSQDGIVVSASMNILQKIAEGAGPRKGLLMLGYAGWSPGQLESEIETGSWITIPASRKLVFDTENDAKWNVAIASLGFDMGHFSSQVGHA